MRAKRSEFKKRQVGKNTRKSSRRKHPSKGLIY